MSSTLYRKYRPLRFSEIIGQQHIVKILSNSIAGKRIGQSYLFTGPRGTGKTTLARIFAKTVNCTSPKKITTSKNTILEPCLKCQNCKSFQNNTFSDVIEIDAASHTGVDNIRELKEMAILPPLQGKFKVYIIDEVHMLSQGAFNALLKILEEPPAHIIFILATTELHKVPETIVSRCQKFNFGKLTTEELIKKLSKISSAEKVKIDQEALKIIAIMAEGGMRDAESLLEQTISLEGNIINSKKIKELFGIIDNRYIKEVTTSLFQGNPAQTISLINEIYKNGFDLNFFVKSWLEYLRKIIIIGIDSKRNSHLFPELTQEDINYLKKLFQTVSLKFIVSCINNLLEVAPKIKDSFLPQLPLEIIVIKLSKKLFIKNNNKIKIKRENKSKKSSTKKNSFVEKNKFSKTSKNKIILKKKKKINPINIKKIEENWKDIIKKVGQKNFSLSMILTNSKPILDTEKEKINIVVLKDFHKEIINKQENRLTIKDISNKITELEFDIYAITENESDIKLRTILPKESVVDTDNADDRSTIAKNTQNSLLNDALNLMGGTVVEE